MNKNIWKIMTLLALVAALWLPGMALAFSVDPFQGTVESFEGIAPSTPGNGTGGLEYTNNFTIGHGAVTTFAPGVTFTAPLIPDGYWYYGGHAGDPFINDFRFGAGVTNMWSGTGYVTPDVVPNGTAWVGTFNNNYADGPRNLEFSFASAMLRVGAYVTGPAGYPITMQAYDAAGHLLDTQYKDPVPVAQWGSNWIGIQVGDFPQISKVVFSNVDIGVDKLTYASSNVPLPPSMLLLGSGLLGLVCLRRKRAI
jgi:hypothetical protein